MMKKINFSIIAAVIAVAMMCGNSAAAAIHEGVLSVDEVLKQADGLVNDTISFEGYCTHACKHGATKIFLRGSSDSSTIRVHAGSLRAFDTKCVKADVAVSGVLKEQRIDEAYLQRWEKRLAKAAAKKEAAHSECSTEKKARGETANTDEERIADFRKRIEERTKNEGKNYLSFYFVKAVSYEIKK